MFAVALNADELAHYGAIKTEYTQITYYHEVLKTLGQVAFPVVDTSEYISPTKKLVRLGGMSKWSEETCSTQAYVDKRLTEVREALEKR